MPEAARASAEVFSRINPLRINIMTLTVFDNATSRKTLHRAPSLLAAEREMVLEIATSSQAFRDASFIEAGHDTNMVHFDGVCPRDQER